TQVGAQGKGIRSGVGELKPLGTADETVVVDVRPGQNAPAVASAFGQVTGLGPGVRRLAGGPGTEQGQPPPGLPKWLHVALPARGHGHGLEGCRRVGEAVPGDTTGRRDTAPVVLEAVYHDALKIGTRGVRLKSDPDDAVVCEHHFAVGGTRTARGGIVLADVPELVDEQPLRKPRPGHDIRAGAEV